MSLWLLKVNGSHFFELKPGEFNVVVTGTSVLSVMISKLLANCITLVFTCSYSWTEKVFHARSGKPFGLSHHWSFFKSVRVWVEISFLSVHFNYTVSWRKKDNDEINMYDTFTWNIWLYWFIHFMLWKAIIFVNVISWYSINKTFYCFLKVLPKKSISETAQ